MLMRLSVCFIAIIVLGMQQINFQIYSTQHFQIRYQKDARSADAHQLGEILEQQYNRYRKIFSQSFNDRVDVYAYTTIGRFRYESQSRIFDDGDMRNGKLYLVLPPSQKERDKQRDVVARLITRALLEKVYSCPPWFAEAYSLYAGNDLLRFGDPANYTVNNFDDLSEDYSRLSDGKDVKELYAKLAATIGFLINRYGESKVEVALNRFKKGGTQGEVFEGSFNEKISDIEKAWVKALRSPHKN